MTILGISGSNRKEGNSYFLLKEMLQEISSTSTTIVQVAELNIKPCELCFESCSAKPFECVVEDDFKVVFEEMKSADGIIFACPFYFYIPSKFQALLERLSCLDYFTQEKHGEGHNPLAGKPCLLVAVSASGSSFNAFQILHHLQEFALMLHMKPFTVNSWPFIGFSAKSGDVKKATILRQTEVIKQAKELAKLLTSKIEKRKD